MSHYSNIDRNQVVLVDSKDNPIGTLDKLVAHVEGKLHRAFSVFIFNDKNEMLLQQRSKKKYHGGELWTNACCSHPQINENILESARERLSFEMGLHCDLQFIFSFIYYAEVENNLIEHEFDHVFIGYTTETPILNKDEVQNFEWIGIKELQKKIIETPENYTYWFKKALPEVLAKLENQLNFQ